MASLSSSSDRSNRNQLTGAMSSRELVTQPRTADGSAHLSASQERLWFLEKLNPDGVSPTVALGFRITGTLDTDLFQRVLQLIVQRHESLRTVFATTQLYAGVDSEASQLISLQKTIHVSVTDISGERSPWAAVEDWVREKLEQPFDLSLGPLFRVAFLKLDAAEHVLLVFSHAIVADKHSLGVVTEEIMQAYAAALAGETAEVASVELQFADYAEWERRVVANDAFAEARAYWREKLRTAPAIIELPTDKHRPAVRSWRGGSLTRPLPKNTQNNLKQLRQTESLSDFQFILTAFAVLLWKYSRQSDFVIGTQVGRRDSQQLNSLVGPLADWLPLRITTGDTPSFKELLQRVRETMDEAERYQHLPFGKLVEELSLEPSLSYTPVFQVACNIEEQPASRIATADLEIVELELETATASVDLSLTLLRGPEKNKYRIDYSSSLFERHTVERIADNFEVLLDAAVADPLQTIDDLPLLSSREKVLLEDWNPWEPSATAPVTIVDLFARQVRETPEAVAVTSETTSLTFAELDQRSNQLGHLLQQQGVGVESLVGICLPRSAEMVLALLAVVKAGGAYLPMDPSYPEERLRFIQQDARVSLVITTEDLNNRLPLRNAFILEARNFDLRPEKTSAPVASLSADNLVYVIYTSGSTGAPKGVMVTHRGLVNYLEWGREILLTNIRKRSLVQSTLAFDLTVTSLLLPLVYGYEVVLIPEEQVLERLAKSIRKSGCGLLKMTPSHVEGLSYLLRPEDLRGQVDAIVIGGETLTAETVSFWRQADPKTRLINEYGPTETVVGCTTYELTADDPISGPLPIGRPIANTTLFVLDERMRRTPIGVPGELYVGGAGVSRGYLNRPALTAERFVPHPFSRLPAERLYKTGDLVRFRHDGNVEYLGRTDDQVKIRGYRIEPGEIENVIMEFSGVRATSVVAQETPEAGKHLVAFVVSTTGDDGNERALQSFLASKLPQYMLPSAYAWLEHLPLTTNGKVDRRKLAQTLIQAAQTNVYVAPRNDLEEQLVQLWQKVLGNQQIGINDNFFEIGGHSLLAARLFAQIENRFGRNIPLAALFSSPTIAELADLLGAGAAKMEWSSLVPIQPEGNKPPLFCVHPAGANVLVYRPLARHLGLEQPLFALQAKGLDGHSKPFARVEEMASHYIREIRAVQPAGPYFLLGASFGGLVVFEMALQLQEAGQETVFLGMLNTNCPVYSFPHRLRCYLGHLRQAGIKKYGRAVLRSFAHRLGNDLPALEQRPVDPELRQAMETKLDMKDPLVRTIIAILEANDHYKPYGKVFTGQITMFWARDAESDFEDNRLGWRKMATKGLDVHVIPGTHTTIREEPNVAFLVEKLRPLLDILQAKGN